MADTFFFDKSDDPSFIDEFLNESQQVPTTGTEAFLASRELEKKDSLTSVLKRSEEIGELKRAEEGSQKFTANELNEAFPEMPVPFKEPLQLSKCYIFIGN